MRGGQTWGQTRVLVPPVTLDEWPGLCGPLFLVCQVRTFHSPSREAGGSEGTPDRCLGVPHSQRGVPRSRWASAVYPHPAVLPWVVGFREDCLLRFVCFLNGDHRLLGQNVYKVTKTTSGSGAVPGRQQVLRGASQWVERPPALWVGLSPAWLHILPVSPICTPSLRTAPHHHGACMGPWHRWPCARLSPSHGSDGSYRAEPRAASPWSPQTTPSSRMLRTASSDF